MINDHLIDRGPGIIARLKDKRLDAFWTIIHAKRENHTLTDFMKTLRYGYRKVLATTMRKQGFKFCPVLKDESLETENRCDYRMSLNITDKKLTVNITLG
jgi:hypothetical protein